MSVEREPAVLRRWRAAWLAALSVLVCLTVVKHMADIGIGGRWGYTVAAALQLYLPVFMTRKHRDPNGFLGLRVSRRIVWQELRSVGLLCLVFFPLFAVGHHFWQSIMFSRVFSWSLPEGIADLVLTHTLAVALPEELFYRGYLQPSLEERWSPRRSYFGVKLGLAAVVSAALFALGHYLGEYNPIRFGPFFPALIFAWLRNRRGSVWGAVLFHALANILSAFLFACYTP